MKTFTTYRTGFRSSHSLTVPSPCGTRPHGHDWKIAVTYEGTNTVYFGDVDAIVRELDWRDLNEMVRGADPTPYGIAGWALERLRGLIPGVRSVTVGYDGYEAVAEV